MKYPHWSRLSERGSALGLAFCRGCYQIFGKRLTLWLLLPAVAYFFLTSPSARHASKKYLSLLRARYPNAKTLPAPGPTTIFRHMMTFAESCIDKFAAWQEGPPLELIDFPNRAEFDSVIASGKGAVLISAHLGNLELARALAKYNGLAKVSAVVYTEHAARFQRLLASSHPEFGINLLHIPHFGPDTGMLLKERIDRGELVVIVGDRTPPGDDGRVCSVDFLGSPAQFAQGPFILPSILDCPVYLFFCLKGAEKYCIHFEHFSDKIQLPRHDRIKTLQSLIQRFAVRLEQHCLCAPLQWFNFYDYWAGNLPMDALDKTGSRAKIHASGN